MKNITLVTDSTWDRGLDKDNPFGVRVVALNINFGEEQYLDGIDLDQKAFLEKLSTAKVLPTTSQPSPHTFEVVFREELEKGNKVLYIGVDGVLSGTFNSATLAKESIGSDDIYLVDSKTVTLGLGLLVEIAIKLLQEENDIEVVVNKLIEIKDKVRIYACVDTLKFLQKGGRLSSTKALIGGILKLKPILEVKHGIISSYDKARGQKAALQKVADIAIQSNIDTRFPVSFGHVNSLDILKPLEELIKEKVDIKESFQQDIGPVVATHAGPGAFGFACVIK